MTLVPAPDVILKPGGKLQLYVCTLPMLEGAVNVILAPGPGQTDVVLAVGLVLAPPPFARVGVPVNTVIVTVLLDTVVGDAQVAFEVIVTDITSPFAKDAVYDELLVPTLTPPFFH